MTTIAWEMTHAVETNASPAFAWNYWTDVANWELNDLRIQTSCLREFHRSVLNEESFQ